MTEKVAHLKRTISPSDLSESFGFTVVGGKGAPVPAVVWSVERNSSADISGKVVTISSTKYALHCKEYIQCSGLNEAGCSRIICYNKI